ncbi:hypothetical protein ABW21_db0203059 [Orbilia brochopaga]|nr:hypothetical protein ABW21_db0203059 [Drechslerella brochopaga]
MAIILYQRQILTINEVHLQGYIYINYNLAEATACSCDSQYSHNDNANSKHVVTFPYIPSQSTLMTICEIYAHPLQLYAPLYTSYLHVIRRDALELKEVINIPTCNWYSSWTRLHDSKKVP